MGFAAKSVLGKVAKPLAWAALVSVIAIGGVKHPVYGTVRSNTPVRLLNRNFLQRKIPTPATSTRNSTGMCVFCSLVMMTDVGTTEFCCAQD